MIIVTGIMAQPLAHGHPVRFFGSYDDASDYVKHCRAVPDLKPGGALVGAKIIDFSEIWMIYHSIDM